MKNSSDTLLLFAFALVVFIPTVVLRGYAEHDHRKSGCEGSMVLTSQTVYAQRSTSIVEPSVDGAIIALTSAN